MTRHLRAILLSLFLLATLVCARLPVSAQEAKKDDPAKKKDAKSDAPKKEQAKKVDSKDAPKKDEAAKEEPKKEPFVPDTPLKELKGHADWINALVISGNGKYIATASRDRTIKVWEVDTAKDVATLKGSPGNVKAVVFLDGSAKVASSAGKWNKEKKAWEGEIKIWDAKLGKQIRSIKGHTDAIEGLALSKDGKFLASASEDQTVKIWDLATSKDVQTLKGHTGMVQAVAFTHDGKKLATASADRTIKIWDAASGKDLATFKVETPVKKVVPPPKKADAKKKDAAKKDEAKKDDAKTKKDADSKKETITMELGRPFTSVAFSPDDKKLCAGNLDGQIKIYDVAGGKDICTLKAHEGVWAVAYNSDGAASAQIASSVGRLS
jgi:WD40 repeat protein